MKKRFTVVIDNYNYAGFLGDAVAGVIGQTFADWQLLIVDDGSTDNSLEVARRFDHPDCRVIAKPNGGQLSAFNAAVDHIDGEITCFLDADDAYNPAYLERIDRFYRQYGGCDVLCCQLEIIGGGSGLVVNAAEVIEFGAHPLISYYLQRSFGIPTSGLSVRTDLLRRLLPQTAIEPEWRIRADDILIWGLDMLGGRKYFCPEPLVRYRIHGNNGYCGKAAPSPQAQLRRRRAAEEFSRRCLPDFDLAAAIRAETVAPTLPGTYLRRALLRAVREKGLKTLTPELSGAIFHAWLRSFCRPTLTSELCRRLGF